MLCEQMTENLHIIQLYFVIVHSYPECNNDSYEWVFLLQTGLCHTNLEQ